VTETEWFNATNPYDMLSAYKLKTDSDRKIWLFSVACLRSIWHLLTDERSRKVVEATEEFADGRVSLDNLRLAHDVFYRAYEDEEVKDGALGNTHEAVQNVCFVGPHAAISVSRAAADAVGAAASESVPAPTPGGWSAAKTDAWESARASERAYQANLLRDIFGPLPFRQVAIDPTWLRWNSGVVAHLAEAVYEERCPPDYSFDYSRLGILADALEDAGCSDSELLGHLRGPFIHVRGCWVIDLLLGKT
jgi:hypothetical protein